MTVQSLNQPLDKSLLEAVSEADEELPDELRELTTDAEQSVRWEIECGDEICMP